jgi:hypothetical protein
MSMDKLILTSLFVLRIPFIRIVGLTVLLLSLNVTNSLMIHYKMSLKRILSTCKGKKITNILWNSVDWIRKSILSLVLLFNWKTNWKFHLRKWWIKKQGSWKKIDIKRKILCLMILLRIILLDSWINTIIKDFLRNYRCLSYYRELFIRKIKKWLKNKLIKREQTNKWINNNLNKRLLNNISNRRIYRNRNKLPTIEINKGNRTNISDSEM